MANSLRTRKASLIARKRDAAPAPDRRGDFEAVRTLGGNSGASVLLCTRGGESFVRKKAVAPGTNPRLRKQAIKQRLFAAQGLPYPAVRSIGYDDHGHTFFEMDYIPSCTVADAIVTDAPIDSENLVRVVRDMLWQSRACVSAAIDPETFATKLSDVFLQVARSEPARDHRDAIDRLVQRLTNADWSGIPASPGHGDLTLENILLAESGGVFFIDCDEPFATSFWLDIAKLFQDFYGHWCLRDEPSADEDSVARLEALAEPFHALAAEADPRLPERLNQLAALSLFRTLPYAREADTVAFTVEAAERVLDR